MRRQDIADGMRIKKKKKRLRGLQPKMAAHSCAMAAIALPTQFRPTGDEGKVEFLFHGPLDFHVCKCLSKGSIFLQKMAALFKSSNS